MIEPERDHTPQILALFVLAVLIVVTLQHFFPR
jgi:hypothetical protein